MSPPEREGPDAVPDVRPIRKSARASEAANHDHDTATVRQCGAGLRRRRAASYRCEPLASGHRDPFQPYRPERPSENQVDAYADAVEHLEESGLVPAAFMPEARGLWSRGGSGRVTASRVVRRWSA